MNALAGELWHAGVNLHACGSVNLGVVDVQYQEQANWQATAADAPIQTTLKTCA